MFLSRARCHCPVKAWNTSIYHQKLMELMPCRICALELMPGRISAFKLPGIDARSNLCIGIDARSNSVKNETIHVYKYNITFIEKYFIGKKPTKLYNEAEVHLRSKSTGYIKLLQF